MGGTAVKTLLKRPLRSVYQLICRVVGHGIAEAACRCGCIDSEWREILCRIADTRPSIDTNKTIREFLSDKIFPVKKAETWEDRSLPSVLCVEKNSMTLMKHFIPYYRNLGIRHFIFIDNNSTDKTFEYLKEQKDVTLFSAPSAFEHHRQVGWLLHAIRMTGTDRRYLRLDSDEFLTWQGMEEYSLPAFLQAADKKEAGSLRALLVDMYPDHPLFDESFSDENFPDEYIFFDGNDSYFVDSENNKIYGGMRKRLFDGHFRQDKNILLDPAAGVFPVNNHDVTVNRDKSLNSTERPCCCALRHYQFLFASRMKYIHFSEGKSKGYGSMSDLGKYSRLAEEKVTAMYDGSRKYESSESLREIKLIRPLFSIRQ